MRSTTRTILLNYGGAVILTGLAVLLRWLLHPWLGDQLPLTTLYGAVAIAVWLGGYRQALFVTVIGFLACAALFIEPRGTFGLDSARSLIGFSAYLCSCAIIVGFGEAMRVARRRSEFRRRQVEQQASQRGQADRAVKEALEYADNIVATVREPLLVLDADLQVRTANRAFYETFRVSPKETEGCFLFDLGNGQWNVPQLRTLLTDILPQNTTVEDFEIQHTFPSIGQRVMRLNARRIHQDIGTSVLILLAIEDITSHEQAQKALRASEEKFSTLFHASPIAISLATLPDGVMQDVNQAWLALTGFTRNDVVGKTAIDLGLVIDAGVRESILAEFRQHGAVRNAEMSVVTKAGARHTLLINLGTVEIGGCPFILSINEDITDRKQAEEQLRASEECLAAELGAMTRLHALSTRLLSAADLRTALDDVLENAIVTSGADFGNIQLYNPQAGALEIVAHRGFRPDFLAYFRRVRVDEGSACAQAMRSGQRIILEDVELDPAFEPHRRIAAAAGYRAVQSTPLKSRNGSVLGMLSTHFRLPQRVSERNQRLLDLYARHAADLIERLRTEEALIEADRRKDEFLAVLAHELRNPLAPVRNAVAVMRLRDVDDPNLRWARDIIDRQVQQMTRLVDDLLDVSRITRGKVKLQKESVDLAAVVARAVEISRPLIDARRHGLAVTLPPEPVRLEADATRLAQVVANLLNNAAKYTEEQGLIWLTVERDGGEAVVRVRDTGVGIPAEMLAQVFDLFTQVAHSEDRSQGGLGIGLTLARSLVEMHGGSVRAHSDGPGQGSEFVVRLPLLAELRSEASGPGVNGRLVESSARRILVVEDNVDAADSLAMLLRLLGNDVRTAHDGPAALAAARAYRPDVVLLDLGLPRMSGYEVCRRLREEHFANGPLVVALTGYGQDEDRRRTREAGFDRHLVKPVNPEELREVLAEGHGSPHSPASDPERAGGDNRRSAHPLWAG